MKGSLLHRFSIISFTTFVLLAMALSLVMYGFIKARVLDILAVADTYDALISERPYRCGLSAFEAVEVLRRCRESQLDPQVVEAFLTVPARQGPSERR